MVLRRITLPMLKEVIAIAFIIRFMDAYKFIDHVSVMTQGGPSESSELPVYIAFQKGIREFQVGEAAAQAWLIFAVAAVLITLFLKYMKRVLKAQANRVGPTMSRSNYRLIKTLLLIFLGIWLVFTLFPIYFMIITSLKPVEEINRMIPTFWPHTLKLNNYAGIFADPGSLKSLVGQCHRLGGQYRIVAAAGNAWPAMHWRAGFAAWSARIWRSGSCRIGCSRRSR